MNRLAFLGAAALALLLAGGCSPRITAPFSIEEVRVGGPRSVAHDQLTSLPTPKDKVVVATYRFRDQTGQYRALENVSTFSTAVTQGATSILLRALEDSGWFTPIEREGLSNLLNERQIISTTRQQYTGPEGEALAPLPPLLYAGILLEGGIIGYDTNLITGGAGVRYLGTGVSGQYRQDQVTIYIRAVSTQNGRILKTVHTTKTILSQKVDGGLFRFVDLRRLLETEVGYSTNEPPVLAVTAAIEEAVTSLIIEGIRDGLWALDTPDSPEARAMFERYDARVDEDAERDAFDRLLAYDSGAGRVTIEASGGLSRIESDFANPDPLPVGSAALRYRVSQGVSIGIAGQTGQLDAGAENRVFAGGDAHLHATLFPSARATPYVSAGVGLLGVWDNPADRNQFVYGALTAGVEIKAGSRLGILLEAAEIYPFQEGLDSYIGGGSIHDNLLNFRVGLAVHL